MASSFGKSASLRLQCCFFSALVPLLLLPLPPLCRAQSTPAPAGAPVAQPRDLCTGVFVSYQYSEGARIRPFLSDAANQPYSFKSTATILNAADVPLKSWNLFVGFRHREVLVSSDPAVLTDGSPLPARVGNNGTFFSGFPNADLKTAIDTAGDINQIQVQIELVGTQFGVAPPAVPLPETFYLANDGYNCPDPTRQGTNLMYTCCTIDPNFKAAVSEGERFLPRKDGDLTMAYDVIQSHGSSYLALVTISNHNPLGRLDNWKLSWEWMRGEFIFGMKGAYTTVTDASDCIFGEQGGYYQGLDFTQVMNCQRTPTIVDLPLSMANDTNVGLIPSCCRNGTLLPPYMDPSKSVSAFQLQVYKMPPDVNRTQLFAPQNWKISGNLNPDYQCGPPVRVSPAQYPNPSGLQSTTAAIASWQVVCNITQAANSKPRCCVSFSAFYNDSVIPCQTCACGCPSNVTNTCSSRAPALLLPSESLLVPFDNRTQKAVAWADVKHFNVPRPLPCGDFCGVSINWHVFTDYSKGWSARITLFNWEDSSFADWFTAVQMDKAFPGFEAVYSFNGSSIDGVNDTIFLQGRPGLNYLVAEVDGADPEKEPRVPGKQQSVISFTKKSTPGIDVVGGDGFPSKVFFNGEECSLPLTLPTGEGGRTAAVKTSMSLILVLACLFFLLMEQP